MELEKRKSSWNHFLMYSLITRMINSSKDKILLRFKTWSQIALSFDGLVFLDVKGYIPICFPDLILKCLFFSTY